MTALPRFYPVVDSFEWVQRLVPVGVKLIQLRIKGQSQEKLRDEIEKSRTCCQTYGALLVINDYWQLAIDLKADFIHIGQEDLEKADIKAIRAHHIKFGVSTHDHDELDNALAVDPDYIALGPIFPTTSKVMSFGPQGMDRITEWKKRIGSRPLVAIGGITLEKATPCLAHGADSVAAISDITHNPYPEKRAQAWLEETQ